METSDNQREITCILSPLLVNTLRKEGPVISVIVDILRATTTICTAVYYGAEIIPVATLKEVNDYRQQGFPIAGERLEKGLEFADFGNSALEFMTEKVRGRKIVHSSTNGTRTMMKVLQTSPEELLVGSFSNIDALTDYIAERDCNVEIVCSGWRGNFCLEDTMFAGFLAQKLMDRGFMTKDDSVFAALMLRNEAQKDMSAFLEKAAHIHKLRRHKLDDVFPYTFTWNTCPIVPKLVLDNGRWEIHKA
ncbi:MAG: 2-phosphosulfolactate phosphatase [Bacteroidales bacterium]|nr:2-phosphosulfolactate phosphatase [Bacteroidales bacterium]